MHRCVDADLPSDGDCFIPRADKTRCSPDMLEACIQSALPSGAAACSNVPAALVKFVQSLCLCGTIVIIFVLEQFFEMHFDTIG